MSKPSTKLSSEELEEFRKKLEKQQARNIQLSELERKYRELIKTKQLKLDIKWQNEISEIDKVFLFSKVTLAGFNNFEDNFTVEYLDLDRILNFHCKGEKKALKTYPKTELWSKSHRSDSKITKLIEYILKGKKLCPIIIGYEPNEYSDGKDVFHLYDGNHRTALYRFLKIKEVPFIIKKEQLEKIRNL
jgi:hypothetical protein